MQQNMRRMNFRFGLLLLVLSLLSGATVSAHEKPWTEVRSPHFRVLTNAGPTEARDVAHEFEQLRYVFARTFQGARLEAGAPLLVFAVRDEETAKALEPHLWRTGSNRAGEFHHGWQKQYAIVRLDSWGGDGAKEVVYHEYTHAVLHMNAHWLPLWLDEGTAEFYAYTRFEGHRIYIGAPTERYRTLRGKTPLPVETLINLKPNSPYYLDGDKNQLFYAESWALVHLLTYGHGMENGKQLGRFFELLQQGTEQTKAFQQVFGDYKGVDKLLSAYMQQPTFTTTMFKDAAEIDEKNATMRILSVAETEAELGGYHLWTHDLAGARPLIEQALEDDPKLGLAHENMGFIDFADGKDAEAANEFSRACELDSSLYLSLFYGAMLSPLPTSTRASDLNTFGQTVGKVLQLNPQFAPGYVQLARLAARENDLTSALLVARKAEELEPSLAGYHLLTGQILLRMGTTADAAAHAKFVADRWIGPDHDEAVELWNKVPPDRRPGGDSLAETAPADVQTVEGTVKSVTCGDPGQWSFVLGRGNDTLTFRRKGGFISGFSDLIWYGGDFFTLCHHLEGMRAVVRYHAPSDPSYAGDVAEIGIRDDLPAPLASTGSLTVTAKP